MINATADNLGELLEQLRAGGWTSSKDPNRTTRASLIGSRTQTNKVERSEPKVGDDKNKDALRAPPSMRVQRTRSSASRRRSPVTRSREVVVKCNS